MNNLKECGLSGRKLSYNELFLKCRRFASSLRRLGLKKGDTIGIYLPNTVEYPIALLGGFECNAVLTTINPNYKKDEVIFQFSDSKPRWIICNETNLNILLKAKNEMKANFDIICIHNSNGDPPNCDSDIIRFEELIRDSVEITENVYEDDELFSTSLILYSSGTTGKPKGTCLTPKSVNASLTQLQSPFINLFAETTNNHQDVVPAFLPFFHIYGLVFVLLQSILKGVKLVTLPHFNPKLYLNILENNQNIIQIVVPPIILFLGNNQDVKAKHLKSTRELMTGGTHCSSNDIEKVRRKTNTNISFSQGYGLTEACTICFNPERDVRANHLSIGRLVSNTWGKISDLEDGKPLPPNTPGEICIKGPQMMKCYLNNLEGTSKTIDSDGWLLTGDIGYYDQDGYFYITDRLKEMIKVNGFQVAPSEIEEVLRRHPKIFEAGIVGVPSERTGEAPVAFVQTIPGAEISEEDVKTFVSSHLSKHKHLSSVKFVESIPKTLSGKILRRDLKKFIAN